MALPPEAALLLQDLRPEVLANPTQFEQVRRTIEEWPEEQQYALQKEVMDTLIQLQDENSQAISNWYSYVVRKESWKNSCTEEIFKKDWSRARSIHKKHEENKAYITKIRDRAAKDWGEENASALFKRIHTRTMAEQVSKMLGRRMTYEQARAASNREILARLNRPGRGNRRNKELIQGDLSKAANGPIDAPEIRDQDLKKHGLKYDQDDFLIEIGADELFVPVEGPSAEVGEGGDDSSSSNYTTDSEDDLLSSRHQSPSSQDSTTDTDTDTETDEYTPYLTPKETPRKHNRSLPARVTKDTRGRKDTQDNTECECVLSNCTLQHLENRNARYSDEKKRILIRKVIQKIGAITADTLCYRHAKGFCRCLGLYTRQFGHPKLITRLKYACSQVDSWEFFVSHKSDWFVPRHLPKGLKARVCSSFRYVIKPPVPRVANYTDAQLSLEDICTRIYGASEQSLQRNIREFEDTGSIVLPGLFSWLEDDISDIEGLDELNSMLGTDLSTLLELIHVEFAMYDYHCTPATSRTHTARNQSMFHSLTQQLTRQDICYYAAYVAVRPDHAWRLTSFPYTKSSASEDTEFMHIDLDIEEYLATGEGGSEIKGSVSFTDEDQENCAVLLPKMHQRHILQGWWEHVKANPTAQTSGPTIAVHPWMWNRELAMRFETDYTRVPCKTGDVRLTLPMIPHGSTGPATIQRRTVMPRFGVVSEDHEHLETGAAESSKWEDIAASNRDMKLAPYSFPATVQLTGLGAISDALLGRIRWDEWSVITELDVLFGENRSAAHRWIQCWRKQAARQFVRAFQAMISAENMAYGGFSYFSRLREGLLPEPHLMDQDQQGSGDVDDDDDDAHASAEESDGSVSLDEDSNMEGNDN